MTPEQKAKQRAIYRKWYLKHPHYHREWRKKNQTPEQKAKRREYYKEWCKKHPRTPEQKAKLREYHRKWYDNHKIQHNSHKIEVRFSQFGILPFGCKKSNYEI